MSFKYLLNCRFPHSFLLFTIYLLKNLIYKVSFTINFAACQRFDQMISDLFNWIFSGTCSFVRTHRLSVFHSFSLTSECLDPFIYWRRLGGDMILSFSFHLFIYLLE